MATEIRESCCCIINKGKENALTETRQQDKI
nr:MAG TPA: hypothetical protein [Caudoviricetes sp.]